MSRLFNSSIELLRKYSKSKDDELRVQLVTLVTYSICSPEERMEYKTFEIFYCIN